MNYDLYIRIGGVALTCICWYCDSNKIKVWSKLHRKEYSYLMGTWGNWCTCSPVGKFEDWCGNYAWEHTEKEVKEKFKEYYKLLVNDSTYKKAPDYIQKLTREKLIKELNYAIDNYI